MLVRRTYAQGSMLLRIDTGAERLMGKWTWLAAGGDPSDTAAEGLLAPEIPGIGVAATTPGPGHHPLRSEKRLSRRPVTD